MVTEYWYGMKFICLITAKFEGWQGSPSSAPLIRYVGMGEWSDCGLVSWLWCTYYQSKVKQTSSHPFLHMTQLFSGLTSHAIQTTCNDLSLSIWPHFHFMLHSKAAKRFSMKLYTLQDFFSSLISDSVYSVHYYQYRLQIWILTNV